jgi:hypothetical protein
VKFKAPDSTTIILWAVGFLLCWTSGQDLYWNFASDNWPSTPGTVRIITSKSNGNSLYDLFSTNGGMAIEYQYVVDGRRYPGSRIDFVRSGNNQAERTARLKKYARGTVIDVFHHPTRHELAVLEPRRWSAFALVPIIGGALIIAGFFTWRATDPTAGLTRRVATSTTSEASASLLADYSESRHESEALHSRFWTTRRISTEVQIFRSPLRFLVFEGLIAGILVTVLSYELWTGPPFKVSMIADARPFIGIGLPLLAVVSVVSMYAYQRPLVINREADTVSLGDIPLLKVSEIRAVYLKRITRRVKMRSEVRHALAFQVGGNESVVFTDGAHEFYFQFIGRGMAEAVSRELKVPCLPVQDLDTDV